MADERCWSCDAGMRYIMRVNDADTWRDLVGCRYCIEFFIGPYPLTTDSSGVYQIKVTSILFRNRWRGPTKASINLPAPHEPISLDRDEARKLDKWIKRAAAGVI